jgi:hypothetical protein
VKQIKEEHLLHIIDRLGEYASQKKNDELRGIASIGKVKKGNYNSRDKQRLIKAI